VVNAERCTAWVAGQVQGVGFRWWVRARALELGLVGWAANRDDGRVEVVAEGPAERLETLMALLVPDAVERPPRPVRPGRVDRVVVRRSAARGIGPGFVER
jgi:acylphosphatase